MEHCWRRRSSICSGARTKLPSYYRAGCIIPPLAFEQSSSEDVARRKRFAGDLCVDLTCGLGVDAYTLSCRFKRVIAVERDLVTARVAEINFGRLGADNIEVVCDTAERFIDAFSERPTFSISIRRGVTEPVRYFCWRIVRRIFSDFCPSC